MDVTVSPEYEANNLYYIDYYTVIPDYDDIFCAVWCLTFRNDLTRRVCGGCWEEKERERDRGEVYVV